MTHDLPGLERLMRRIYERQVVAGELVNIPVGQSGEWSVSKFTTNFDFTALRLLRDGRPIGLGTYTRLTRAGTGVFMSDTPAEWDDIKRYFRPFAQGDILMSGLGLGMAVQLLFGRAGRAA
ncbi:MAG: hypothetical protein HC889_16115 [Synechococcaceae cyanobacterium SM1_2_3]|nr:hypothetical protein [Synechococcaceae cyanobacterium SM1_2_3]